MKYKLQVRTSPYVLVSSDFSQQEPRITATVSQDKKMIQSYKDNKDIYATIASLSFNKTYEECLEFHPETHEYQKEGKERRSEAKSIVLGILYGRSTKTIGEQLYGQDKSLTEEERTKKAQGVYNSVLNAFPSLKSFMINAERQARTLGYVETILGRRRHIPDMTLPDFEFEPMPKYVNPDIDPMNPETLKDQNKIPKRITDQLLKELRGYRHFGQVVQRTKELKEEKIRVINNRPRITEASRQIVNCVDKETEILTIDGWKKYNEINVGDKIYSYNIYTRKIEEDLIQNIITSVGETEVIRLLNDDIDALVTPEHKWLLTEDCGQTSMWFQSTHDILFTRLYGKNAAVYEEGYDFGENYQIFGIIHSLNQVLSTKQLEFSENSVTNFYNDVKFTTNQTTDLVWCVTTTNHTWIARRNNKIYITSNSVVQGSAADLTKMAILNLCNNKEWQRLGGRLLTPIHDELLCEVPMENWEEGGKVLTDCMVEAADFMPFKITCDAETTLRWYGNEFPCKYPKPKSYPTSNPEEIKWIQWYLLEMEYLLPVIKDENGDTPRGDGARGISGVITDEYNNSIKDYLKIYHITEDEFLNHIEQKVVHGTVF